MNVDLNPIVAAVALLITAITPALVLRLSNQVHEVRKISNGRLSALIKRVEELRGELEAVKAGRRISDVGVMPSETRVDTQSGGPPPGR